MAAATGVPKKCGKNGAHAAHDHNMLVLFIKTEQPAQCVSDTSAHLERRALTAGRTAKQMRDQCGEEDQRRHLKRKLVIRVDCRDDQIGSGILFVVKELVQGNDDQSSHGEKIDQPWILGAQHRHEGKSKGEDRPAQSGNAAGYNGKYHPFYRYNTAVYIVFEFMFDYFIHTNYPSFYIIYTNIEKCFLQEDKEVV